MLSTGNAYFLTLHEGLPVTGCSEESRRVDDAGVPGSFAGFNPKEDLLLILNVVVELLQHNVSVSLSVTCYQQRLPGVWYCLCLYCDAVVVVGGVVAILGTCERPLNDKGEG
jgi:hypothetical protein